MKNKKSEKKSPHPKIPNKVQIEILKNPYLMIYGFKTEQIQNEEINSNK